MVVWGHSSAIESGREVINNIFYYFWHSICWSFVEGMRLSCRMMQQHNICWCIRVISSEQTPYLRHLTKRIGQRLDAVGSIEGQKQQYTWISLLLFVHSTINCLVLAAIPVFQSCRGEFLQKNPISFIGTNQLSDGSRPPIHPIPFCRPIGNTITRGFCTDGVAVGLILIAQKHKLGYH
jgi:hypothetical protein